MSSNGGADTATGAGREGRGTAYHRLEGELVTVRAEFESLAGEAGVEGADDGWIQRGRELLNMAQAALEDEKIEQGWSYLHTAKSLSIHGLESVYGADALRGEARELLVEAENAPLSWRAEAVRERISNPDGTLRENLNANDLRAAHELLHEGYESVHRKRQHLQSQFHYLQIGALGTIVVFLLLAIGGTITGLLPSPFFEFPTDSPSENSANPVGFLVYVVLAGVLGATLFGLRSLRRQPVSTSTPQYLTGFQAMVARIVVGGASALALFFFVRSELLTLGSATGMSRGPFLLAVAFAAGYSQRLVHATVESVAGMANSETTDGGGS